MSRTGQPCEGCRDDGGAGAAERTLAAWLRLLCTSCLHEIVRLQPTRAGPAGAHRRLTEAAVTELGRRILERDRA